MFVTNGTTVGTNILSDINLGKTGSFPSPLGTYQGKELFLISKGLDTFIYSANDTTVTEVAKINASNFTKGSEAHTFAPYSNDGSALFFGRTNNKGREIYKFDANTDTVTLPKELETGSFGFEYVSEMFHFKDDTYLFANFTEELGNELWIYDPVNGGRLLKDINTGTSDSFPRDFIVLNNNVYFTAATSTHGREIWKTDGTTAGTNIFLDLTPGSSGGVLSIHNELFNNKLVFIGGNASTGIELGISDGVSLSPVIIDVKTGFLSSNIYDIGIFNNLIFIAAETNSDGVRLVESNGSTFRIINNADNGSIVYPEYFTATEDMLFFVAENATTGRELYRLNKGGVTPQLVKDIVVGAGSSNINYINKIAENKIVFVAEEGSAGEEFWISDGTTSGTNLIKNLFSNYSSNISQVTNVANKVFFVAEDSTIGTELFVTDGTASGTKVVKDINLGSESSFPQSLKNINGTLFFSAYTNQIGYEPYRVVVDSCPTDGTKLEAGICGCGVVDEDFNSNGVIDCLIQNETKQIIKDLQQAIKKLFIKEVINKKTKKKRKTTLKKLRSQLKEFTSFTKLNKNLINFKKVKKYNKARKEFLKAIRALIKSSNPEDKKLSIKYLKQLRRQIV